MGAADLTDRKGRKDRQQKDSDGQLYNFIKEVYQAVMWFSERRSPRS